VHNSIFSIYITRIEYIIMRTWHIIRLQYLLPLHITYTRQMAS